MATNAEIINALRCNGNVCEKTCAFYGNCFEEVINETAADAMEEMENRMNHLEKQSANLLITNDMLREDLEKYKRFADGEKEEIIDEELFSVFDRITSAWYGKQRFFVQKDGSIYDRKYADYLNNLDSAIRRFCEELSDA